MLAVLTGWRRQRQRQGLDGPVWVGSVVGTRLSRIHLVSGLPRTCSTRLDRLGLLFRRNDPVAVDRLVAENAIIDLFALCIGRTRRLLTRRGIGFRIDLRRLFRGIDHRDVSAALACWFNLGQVVINDAACRDRGDEQKQKQEPGSPAAALFAIAFIELAIGLIVVLRTGAAPRGGWPLFLKEIT